MINKYKKLIMPFILLSLLVGCSSTSESVQEIKKVTPTTTKNYTYKYNKNTLDALTNLIQRDLPKEQQVLFKSLYVDNKVKTITLESVYDAKMLKDAMDSAGIIDVVSFNNFIQSTEFDPSPDLYSPINLLKNKKGNCYSYTLLTMFFLSSYCQDVGYEIIADTNTQDGTSHIYLKLKRGEHDTISDLTVNKLLELP